MIRKKSLVHKNIQIKPITWNLVFEENRKFSLSQLRVLIRNPRLKSRVKEVGKV